MVKYSCKTYLSAVKVWHLSRLDLIDMERLKLQYINCMIAIIGDTEVSATTTMILWETNKT